MNGKQMNGKKINLKKNPYQPYFRKRKLCWWFFDITEKQPYTMRTGYQAGTQCLLSKDAVRNSRLGCCNTEGPVTSTSHINLIQYQKFTWADF